MAATKRNSTGEFHVGDLLTSPALEGIEVDIAEVEGAELMLTPPVTVLARTTSVWIYDASCSRGATTSFAIPVTAYGWHTRLGYFRANGARIGLSPIFDWNRSFYAGSRPALRFNGRLPTGTKDLRAFWWYDGSATWWNSKSMAC